jgi:Predicted thiol oxidoreductase
LNDGISQGQAQGDDWRTAPLWGLGDRIFLLHDGRTKDLAEAIRLHDSQGSEARNVIRDYAALPDGQKQDLLNFLRSL